MLAFWGWRIEKGCFKQCEKEWIYYSILNGLQNYGETWKQTNQKTNRLNLQGQRGLSEGNAASSMIKSPAPEPHHINPRRLPLPTWFQDFAVPAVPWISQRDGSFLAIKTNKTGDWRRDTLRMAAKPTAATTAFARKMHHHQWVYFFQVSHRASDDPNLNPIWNLSAEMSKMYTFYLFSLFRTTGGSSTKKKSGMDVDGLFCTWHSIFSGRLVLQCNHTFEWCTLFSVFDSWVDVSFRCTKALRWGSRQVLIRLHCYCMRHWTWAALVPLPKWSRFGAMGDFMVFHLISSPEMIKWCWNQGNPGLFDPYIFLSRLLMKIIHQEAHTHALIMYMRNSLMPWNMPTTL